MPTNQTENYLRLHLLNNEAISVLRATFLKIVDETCNGDVDKFLSEFKQDIVKLNSTQRDILFPANGRTDIKQWDVSLLCLILVSCCTLEGKLCINELKALMKSQIQVHNDIDAFLGFYKTNIDQMKKQGFIDEVQYDQLFPKNTKSNLKEWDLNLLLCILAQFSTIPNKQKLKELLKSCISRDIRLYNIGTPDLTKYLKLKENKCKEMCQKGIIQQDQYDKLFPKDGYSDMNNWDDNLLEMFVKNVCLCLKQETIVAIQIVKQIRNEMLAHKGSAEMETGEFLKTWSKLFNAIEVIVKEEVPQMSQEWKQKFETLNRDPFDISGAIKVLTEYYSKETSEFNSVKDAIQDIRRIIEIENAQRAQEYKCIRNQQKQLIDEHEDMAEMLKYLVGEKETRNRYTVTIDVECIEVKIHVACTNESSKENAERAMRFSIQSVLEGQNTEIKIQTVSKLLEGITKDGSKVESVESGSVLLRVKCFSIKEITKLMLYIGSQEFRNTLKQMEEEIGDDIELGCDFSDESKQHIMEDLTRIRDKDDRSQPLVCSNIVLVNEKTALEVLVDSISSDQKRDVDTKIPVFERIKTFELNSPDDTENSVIASCTFLPTGAFVLCDEGNTNIKMYDKHCIYRSMIRLPSNPVDSCLSLDDNTEVLVTVHKGNIYRISVGDEMKIKGLIGLYQDCYSITSCELGIAVLVFDQNWEILLMQYDGMLVKRLGISLSRPVGMTSILDGTQLVISDDKLLCSVDIHTGEIMFVNEYDDGWIRPGLVTSDGDDNIYVEDRGSNKVIMISCLGEKIGDILTDVDGCEGQAGLTYNSFSDTILFQPNWYETRMCVYKLLN